ncbi:hypothetical protein JW968_04645 [Candidatus Woesearchaeota archaeon]|nr:hypothetical protein [Candidatus Woesearchaeota archaeon]
MEQKFIILLPCIFLIAVIIAGCGHSGDRDVEQPALPDEGPGAYDAPGAEPEPDTGTAEADETESTEPEEPAADIEVRLTKEKTMIPSKLTISKGTTVRFFNEEEKYNHNLIIHLADVKVTSKDDIVIQSGNFGPGETWEFEFEESGIYTIKDIYSGTMRGEITAEVVAGGFMELYNSAEEISKVFVR